MKTFFPFLIAVLIYTSCGPGPSTQESDVSGVVTQTFNEFYKVYEKGTTEFVEYYHEDVRWMGTDGAVGRGRAEFKEGWQHSMDQNHFEVIEYSEPTVLAGERQATAYNDYSERFISKETGDTTRLDGTWISVWQKQPDDSWQVIFHTWHLRDDE